MKLEYAIISQQIIHSFEVETFWLSNLLKRLLLLKWVIYGNDYLAFCNNIGNFRNSLPLKILNILYLQESISFELQVGSKICKFVCLYQSPRQTNDDFEKFRDNFELTLDTLAESNLDLVVVLRDLNIKSKNWYINDKTTTEGEEIEFVTSQFGLHQIINEPTYVLENSSSCIDLIFTSQRNLVVNSGVHPSLHPNCHHQIVYTKYDLKIHFPPPYEWEIWHSGQGNTDLIRRAVHEFNWQRAFSNQNINERVSFFDKIILDIVSNFISHETVICDDRELPWINIWIKNVIDNKKILT